MITAYDVKVMQSWKGEVSRLFGSRSDVLIYDGYFTDGSTTVTFEIESTLSYQEIRDILSDFWCEITVVEDEEVVEDE